FQGHHPAVDGLPRSPQRSSGGAEPSSLHDCSEGEQILGGEGGCCLAHDDSVSRFFQVVTWGGRSQVVGTQQGVSMRSVSSLAFLALSLVGCPSNEEPAQPPGCAVDKVLFEAEGFFPEGVDLAADGTLYVGSLGSQGIWSAGPCKEQAEPFATLQ